MISVVVVLLTSRLMSRWGPARLVPAVLMASAALLLLEWWISREWVKVAAAAVYLHFNALGALLISGFWSVVGERFDPRTAKRQMGPIGAAGTLGGLAGGIIAERVGASLPVTAMLPVLAGLHLLCAGAIRGLARGRSALQHTDEHRAVEGRAETRRPALATLVRVPYLRNLVALVLLAAITECLVDYVFKARAVGASGRGGELMRLFAGFYTGVQLLTFVLQVALTRWTLEALGLARTVAALPAAVGATATGMVFAPGLVTAVVARGTEAVLHNSLYRSGYELLFTPIPRDEKRATKPLVDVGCARLGDALGAGAVQAALLLGPLATLPVVSLAAIITAAGSVLLSLHLHQAYLRALEKSLLARAIQLDLPDVEDSTTRTAFLSTMRSLASPNLAAEAPAAAAAAMVPDPGTQRSRSGPALDPEMRLIAELRSRDAARVRGALKMPLSRELVGHVIPLLAWDEVAPETIRALRAAAPKATGQLVDALLDPEEEFGVRRRIPSVLASVDSPRASDGLVRALADTRFEVRYRAGRALARHQERYRTELADEQIFAAVLREANVSQAVWESQRLLDRVEEEEVSPLVDEFLRTRASKSLEHVFTLLSLVLPRQPLTIAFRGLFTDDQQLRGTALEYLESVLPPAVREKLWPFLEDRPGRERSSRSHTEVLADLMRSHQSIALNLEKLRVKLKPEQSPGS